MKFSQRYKYIFAEVVSFLYILLFVYAAVSKLLDFENFRVQLGQSPLLSAFAGSIAWIVPVLELLIALLIGFKKWRLIGLFASFSLMVMFTTYIYIILNYSSFIPCSCGGILEKLGWTEHLFFNIVFIMLAAAGILILRDGMPNTSLISKPAVLVSSFSATIFFSIGIVGLLFMLSEDIMAKENPFIRRFDQYAIKKIDETRLQNSSFYLAGVENGKIYLGNHDAPLQIIVVDNSFKDKQHYTIQLDRDDFPFRSVEVSIQTPYFYVYDGMVPVIYKGKIVDWKAKTIYNGNHFFTKAIVMDSTRIAFRGQKKNTGEHLMGTLHFGKSIDTQFSPAFLEKQIDGIFDTDGTLQYSKGLRNLVYTYYYRNQYIVANDTLSVLYRGNTIDTTTQAKLNVVKVKLSGDTKLAAPPYMVNKTSAISNNLLFVNSALKGRFENEEVWTQASVIDVYDIAKNEYLSSFYIYDSGKIKIKYFLVTESNLYVISGQLLQKYSLGNSIKKAFKKK
ncbi:DoxX family protein [Flavobacterium sp. NPDC079362]|uniref:Methylamine utilisation protein MauE domain-containing protein n=1 Tax=Flavobacterium collinsii TaxID=1114861 RepID=A0ABM8KHG3_9FLAO|nr:MauE/DoxX family redox-associated membrane protein [Flavobacterium collinsii]CAA9197731.1 hypothetical protein FLACOL7796_01818 [Flavobacterium collinsii]